MKGWLAGPYTLASLPASAQKLINLYPEVIESPEGEKVVGYLKHCPGLATALITLATSPLRGLLAGGSPLTPADGTGGRMFAVAGSKLYEVFIGGTSSLLGDVGDDAAHSPVQMFVNGEQLGIVSAGQFYLHNGVTLVQPLLLASVGGANTYARGAGGASTVIRNGTLVTWSAGDDFTDIQIGDLITIDGVACHVALKTSLTTLYTVETIAGPTAALVYSVYAAEPISGTSFPATLAAGDQITINASVYTVSYALYPTTRVNLTTSPGNQSNKAFSISILNGRAHADGATPTNITWISGDKFPLYGLVGAQLLVNGFGGAGNIVTQVLSSTAMKVVGPTGAFDFNFGINPILAAGSGAFLDSYFIIAPPVSKVMQVSAPLDGLTWDASDIASKEGYPDYIGALFADHGELYVMGESKSEVWRAPGMDFNFPFQRVSGASIEEGIAAPASMAGFLDGVAWIGASLRGKPVAYFAKGFQPERISTHAIEQAWEKFQVSDAVGFSFEMDGHEFWQVSFPTGDQAWVYDRTTSLQFGKPMWHERTSWDPAPATGVARYRRHRACCHCFVWGKHWVGDFYNGKIYELSNTTYTDAGQVIQCRRVMPHLCAERLRQFFFKLQLDMETARGGVALTVVLDWSDDGGLTFVGGGTAFTLTTSTTKTLERLCFWEMGSADDRIFRITVTGNGPKTLLNGYLDWLVGT
jgi:hypothetical protein